MSLKHPGVSPRYHTADEPLWLLIEGAERPLCFEFPPHAHTNLIVGSSSKAAVRVPGSPPVACFIERDGSSIWLTPAALDVEVRLDHLTVSAKQRLFTQSVLELAGTKLKLTVRDTPPTLRADALQGPVATVTIEPCPVNPTSPAGQAPSPPSMLSLKTVELSPMFRPPEPDGAPVAPPETKLQPRPQPSAPVRFTVKTVELAPLEGSPTQVTAPETPAVAEAAVKFDPHRTIEIAPVREPLAPSSSKLKDVKAPLVPVVTSPQAPLVKVLSDTTEFEVPVMMTPSKPARDVRETSRENEAAAAMPSSPKAKAVVAPERPEQVASVSSAPVKQLARGGLLERLGLLAKARPVLVLGSAALGALVLVLFFASVAKLLAPKASAGTQAQPVEARRAPAASASVVASTMPTLEAARPIDARNPTASEPVASVPIALTQTVAAGPAPADVSPAVGHLFAGRLVEAEHSYRELASRYPAEPAFQSIARILARRSSPACRGASPSKSSCPSVKP
ncbi:MAG: hypothetical protein QM784_30480 [Polyangiaceae bacterium]